MQVVFDVIMPSSTRRPNARILAENIAFALSEVGVSLDRLAKVARIPSERLKEFQAATGETATAEELELIAMALGREDGGELLAAQFAPLPITRVERVRERFDRVAPPPPAPAGRKTGPRYDHMSPEQRQRFARNLRARRKSFGWSGAEFATRCGVWQPTVARWEDGEDARAIKPENVERIAAVFGCTVEDLTMREPPAAHELPRVAPVDVQVREDTVFFSLPPGIGPERLPELEREVRALVSRYSQSDLETARAKYPKPPGRPPRR